MLMLHTARIDLIPLSARQLLQYLEQPDQLEKELNISVSRSVVTERVQKAIHIKLEKMDHVEQTRHTWYTYWLLIIRDVPFGAGLLGFKGAPDQNGEVEIGYGIDPDYQNQGYMTEAVQRMIAWAFGEKDCLTVVARDIMKWNVASQRVSEKSGMTKYEESEASLSYRIGRDRTKLQDAKSDMLGITRANLKGIVHDG